MSPSADAVCALHAGTPATGLCDRCGTYFCRECVKEIAGRSICASCLSLPGVDFLGATRARLTGRRDGFIYFLGLVAPLFFALMAFSIPLSASTMLFASVWMVVGIAYLALLPWARHGLLLTIPFQAYMVFDGADRELTWSALMIASWALLVVTPLFATRNRLAFRVPVDEAEMARFHDRYLSNPNASRALLYAAILFFVPFAGALGLVLGVIALRRVDSEAWPPVKGRGQAIAAIVLSLAELGFWSFTFLVA